MSVNEFGGMPFRADKYVSESQGYVQVKPGEHHVIITDAKWADSEKAGQHVVLEVEVTNGPCKGGKLWERFCVHHANEKTSTIARERLGDVLRATGIEQIMDPKELVGNQCTVYVKLGKEYQGERRPVIGRYIPASMNGNQLDLDEVPF